MDNVDSGMGFEIEILQFLFITLPKDSRAFRIKKSGFSNQVRFHLYVRVVIYTSKYFKELRLWSTKFETTKSYGLLKKKKMIVVLHDEIWCLCLLNVHYPHVCLMYMIYISGHYLCIFQKIYLVVKNE